MREDRPSDTASWVAMGRALVHARRSIPRFDDPFALQLLPDDCREVIEHMLQRKLPRSWSEARLRLIARFTARLMGPRTVEIDRGLSGMPPGFQLVILGAGLDSRAYRLTSLADSVVFEVDHPATQVFKRQRVHGLQIRAKELRYVPVDFTKQRLADELERAGHSPTTPTAWIFEGVISYLSPAEVDATIAAMASRSGIGSRLLATYNIPSLLRRLTGGFATRRIEPHRSSFAPSQVRELLARRGFAVVSDRDGVERLQQLGLTPSLGDRLVPGRFHHVVIADRDAQPV